MIGAVALTALCLLAALWLVRVHRHLTGPQLPKADRGPSTRPLKGDLWLWEQETRKDEEPA